MFRLGSTPESCITGLARLGSIRRLWHAHDARTKATLIYRRTKNLRAVQLLGHTKLESTVRYLGIEVDDALEISEQTEI